MRRWMALTATLVLLIAPSCGAPGTADDAGDSTTSPTTSPAVEAAEAGGLDAFVEDPQARASVDGLLADAAALGFTGVVAGVGESGGVGAVRVGEPPAAEPVDDPVDLVFALGSVTKNITAAAAVMAAEQGLVDLDRPIGDYLDDVPADKAAITIDHLLTHTSGLGNATIDETDPIDRDDMVETILALPPIAGPGQRFNYSDAGYTLIAAILDEVTGVDHRSWIAEMLLAPAGMERTGWIGDGSLGSSGVTSGPTDAAQPRLLTELGVKGWGVLGAGGMYSTAGDMVRLLEALPELLGPDGLATYTATHFALPDSDQGEGYGWVTLTFGPDEVELTNSGGEPEVGQSFTLFWPRPSDEVLVIASSASSFPAERLLGDLIAILVDGDRYERDPVLAEAQRLDDAAVESVTGSYETADGAVIELAAQGATFELSSPDAAIYDRLFTDAERDDRIASARSAAEAWLLADPEDLVDDGSADAVEHVATGPVAGGEVRSWFLAPVGGDVLLVELVVSDDGELGHIDLPAGPPTIRLVASGPAALAVTTFQPELVQLERIDVHDGSLTLHFRNGTAVDAARVG